MTTYTMNGFFTRWEDTNGDGEDDFLTTGTTRLRIVASDLQDSFSYQIVPTSDGDDSSLPQVEISGLSPYSITVGGDPFDGQNSGSSIGEIRWGGGNVTQLMSFGDDGLNHIFVIGGAALPAISSPADLQAIQQSATYFGAVTSGPFREGLEIQLDDLAGIRSAERDRIVGSSANETLRGGAGNDTILGGRGNDTLFGDSGRDRIDGGKNNDILVGGDGNDIFVFRKGFGRDVIRDFTDNQDTIRLDDRLWDGDLSRRQVLNQFASLVSDAVVLGFGSYELTLENVGSIGQLFNDLHIV